MVLRARIDMAAKVIMTALTATRNSQGALASHRKED
jgi:hypothetical protein